MMMLDNHGHSDLTHHKAWLILLNRYVWDNLLVALFTSYTIISKKLFCSTFGCKFGKNMQIILYLLAKASSQMLLEVSAAICCKFDFSLPIYVLLNQLTRLKLPQKKIKITIIAYVYIEKLS